MDPIGLPMGRNSIPSVLTALRQLSKTLQQYARRLESSCVGHWNPLEPTGETTWGERGRNKVGAGQNKAAMGQETEDQRKQLGQRWPSNPNSLPGPDPVAQVHVDLRHQNN